MLFRLLLVVLSLSIFTPAFASDALVAKFEETFNSSTFCKQLTHDEMGAVKDVSSGKIYSFVINYEFKFFSFGYLEKPEDEVLVTHFDHEKDYIVFGSQSGARESTDCKAKPKRCINKAKEFLEIIPLYRTYNQKSYQGNVIAGEMFYSNETRLSCVEELIQAYNTTLSTKPKKK